MTTLNKTNLVNLIRLIKYPLKTKKTFILEKQNTYTFIVDKKLEKLTIKKIFSEIFNIEIKKVRLLNVSKKFNYKKIYITFKNSDNLYNILNKICQ